MDTNSNIQNSSQRQIPQIIEPPVSDVDSDSPPHIIREIFRENGHDNFTGREWLPIETQPTSFSAEAENETEAGSHFSHHALALPIEFDMSTVLRGASFDANADSSLDRLREAKRFTFKASGRVDTENCLIGIEDENGHMYSVETICAGRVVNTKTLYIFTDIESGQEVMLVRGEKGNMVARSKSGLLIGITHADKWYKHPNFTASSSSGSSSFLIQSSQGFIPLTWLASCLAKPEFRIYSSGTSLGTMSRISATDTTPESVVLDLTQNVPINSKALLLAASIMIYISHFGETGFGGKYGVRGTLCFSSFVK